MVRILLVLPMLLFTVALRAQENPEAEPPDSGNQPDWIIPTDTQPDATGDWVRPREGADMGRTLDQQAGATLRAQAYRMDQDSKLAVIRLLQRVHSEEGINPLDESAVDILAFLATEGYDYEVRRDGRVINDYPIVRAEAVRLLGAVGGPTATTTLKRVLRYEPDTYVLAAAVTGVAASSQSVEHDLLATLAQLVQRMNALRRPDNELALAVVRAVRDLHTNAGGIDDPDLFRALIAIAQGGYATSVRREAVEVIDLLRKQPQP